MKTMLALPMALLLALSVPALAQKDNGGKGGDSGGKGGKGDGVNWIVRRRKKTKLVS